MFLTLTVRHSGELATDRATIELGWRRWRARAQKHWARSWPYVGVWEVTGSDGGNVRLHVFYHAPGFLEWREMRRWWVDGTQRAGQWVGFRSAFGTAESRAGYLAKYLSKGVDPRVFAAERAAELLVGWKGKRVYTASRGYFAGYAPCCRACQERQELATVVEAAEANGQTEPLDADDRAALAVDGA